MTPDGGWDGGWEGGWDDGDDIEVDIEVEFPSVEQFLDSQRRLLDDVLDPEPEPVAIVDELLDEGALPADPNPDP